MKTDVFHKTGWCRFPFDPALDHWRESSLEAARKTVKDPENECWFRYGRTWFVGVHVLPNDTEGAVPGGPVLTGEAVDFARSLWGDDGLRFDRAQISVCYPGYPKRWEAESEGVHAFRVNRSAAHLDGLLHEGPDRRRYMRQFHQFVLGIPMVSVSGQASPFVIWEGSHLIMQEMLKRAFDGIPSEDWHEVDLTEAYQLARRQVFETCQRLEIQAAPGEAYMTHPHLIHGMAPWGEDGQAGPDGRMIAYFRPETENRDRWLGK